MKNIHSTKHLISNKLNKKILYGKIIKISSKNTIKIIYKKYKKYKKYRKIKINKTKLIHCNNTFIKKGNKIIVINEKKKYSKKKTWKLFKILNDN